MQLVIGNKNYSSWSMRPWLLLRHFEIPFEEIRIPLFEKGYRNELRKYSPTLRVPVLIDGDTTIWDSLAICEYISEKYIAGRALPKELHDRAVCRSYCAEMHSGFMEIRSRMPMNCRARRRIEFPPELLAECHRVDALWSERAASESLIGDYLFGQFSIADCMYAPMAMRFATYGVELSDASMEYLTTVQKNPAVMQWLSEAEQETEFVVDYDVGVELGSL